MNNRKGGRKGSKRGKGSRAMPPAPPDCCYLPFRIVARTRRRRQRFPVNKVIMLDAIKSGNIILVLKSIRRSSLLSSSEGIVNGERRGDKQKQEQKKKKGRGRENRQRRSWKQRYAFHIISLLLIVQVEDRKKISLRKCFSSQSSYHNECGSLQAKCNSSSGRIKREVVISSCKSNTEVRVVGDWRNTLRWGEWDIWKKK